MTTGIRLDANLLINGKPLTVPDEARHAILTLVSENEKLKAERNRSGVELRNAVSKAVLAEREACAQVCEGHPNMIGGAFVTCAEAIRARSDGG